jgi:hypothetical protein
VIKGETPVKERERLFQAFRTGEIELLVVSKVANFSVDLPEAAVAIQVSGSFGSRQEEAQRLGRLLRPKADGGPRASTRSSPATPSTPTSRRTGSGSWPSRATPTGSSTPMIWTGWTSSPAAGEDCPDRRAGTSPPIRSAPRLRSTP